MYEYIHIYYVMCIKDIYMYIYIRCVKKRMTHKYQLNNLLLT